tara:strand:+ start:81 stop:674 length:594 start_codon:yes stop_codon:yes gene_type:complete
MNKKNIFITQREEFISGEARDTLDIRWSVFLDKCNISPIIIPNNSIALKNYLLNYPCDGIVLTGGGLISSLGGLEKRDEIENNLIKYSLEKDKPLIGICRGMQQIQSYYGVDLKKINGHVGSEFLINFQSHERKINSYHDYGTENSCSELIVTSRSNDNIIKSITHSKNKIHGIMWHPERNNPLNELDIKFFKGVFQ